MSTLAILGIIAAGIFLLAFFLFMALLVVMGIIYDEDPKYAEALLSKWFKNKR